MPHTPGPWTFFESLPRYVSPLCPTTKHLVGADGQGFALTVGLREPTDTANARLIAAAPELYEELGNALAFLRTVEWNDSTSETNAADLQHAIEAALAHADGNGEVSR